MSAIYFRFLWFWCPACCIVTRHELQTDKPAIDGLAWRCDRCHRDHVKTAHQASMGQRHRP